VEAADVDLSRLPHYSHELRREMAIVFFRLVPSKAAKLGVSAVALLSVIGGFYFASAPLPQSSSETEAIETKRSGQPRTEQDKSKFEVSERREPLADARGQIEFEALRSGSAKRNSLLPVISFALVWPKKILR